MSNLCSILGEDVEYIIEAHPGEQIDTRPHIAVREEYFDLYVEGALVATCTDLREALLLMVWCMTVFHQKHNKGAKKTVVFLERYVLGVHHPVKVPMIVGDAYKKLRKFL